MANYLVPVQFYQRWTSNEIITVHSPMNNLVDTVLPETPESHELDSLVDAFLADRSNATLADAINARLQVIIEGHDAAVAALKSVGLTGAETRIIDQLRNVANDGTSVMEALTDERTADPPLKETVLNDLTVQSAPQADVQVGIIPTIQKLANAIPDLPLQNGTR
jgi:hypothetical protein